MTTSTAISTVQQIKELPRDSFIVVDDEMFYRFGPYSYGVVQIHGSDHKLGLSIEKVEDHLRMKSK